MRKQKRKVLILYTRKKVIQFIIDAGYTTENIDGKGVLQPSLPPVFFPRKATGVYWSKRFVTAADINLLDKTFQVQCFLCNFKISLLLYFIRSIVLNYKSFLVKDSTKKKEASIFVVLFYRLRSFLDIDYVGLFVIFGSFE